MIKLGNVTRGKRLFLVASALVLGFGAASLLLVPRFRGEAKRQDFARNSEFIRSGRPAFAICISDLTTNALAPADLSSRIGDATKENRRTLWKGSFLEAEPIVIESPCPTGPSIDEKTSDISQYLADIRVVDKPGPYVVNVFVVEPSFLDTLARLNLGRVEPYEFIDPDPRQPGGYQQVSAAVYVSAAEFDQPAFLARNVAEALGCTETCSQVPE